MTAGRLLPIWIALLLSAAVVVGCAGAPALEAGPAGLPRRLTLLDSEEAACAGTVQIGAGRVSAEGSGPGPQYFVEPGQSVAFRLADEAIEWACIGERGAAARDTRCPEGATHVRVTRAAARDELLIECYG